MQKIWSSKSKRSQSPSEATSETLPETSPETAIDTADIIATQDSKEQVSTGSTDLISQDSEALDTCPETESGSTIAPLSTTTPDDPKWFSQYLPKIIADNLIPPREWQFPTSWLILAIGLGGLAIVTSVGMRYLTVPDSPTNSFSCKSKIQGDWQTPFGKLTLKENANLVSGKYEYVNFEKGKVVGELTGEVNNNIISFKWQETSAQQLKSQGQGTLIFAESCQEFYGSYDEEGKTNSFASWQGYRINQ